MTAPDFDSIDAQVIQEMGPEILGAALSQALLSLHEGGGDSLEGALDLCDAGDVVRLREALWTVHLGAAPAAMPQSDPYAEVETSELQEACAALLTRACKDMSFDLPDALRALGEDQAISMITVIEDWETRYQPDDLDP